MFTNTVKSKELAGKKDKILGVFTATLQSLVSLVDDTMVARVVKENEKAVIEEEISNLKKLEEDTNKIISKFEDFLNV